MNEASPPSQIELPLGLPPADETPATHEPGTLWRVGTLSYTTAALVVLFAWLLWGDFAWALKDRTVLDVVQLLIHKFHASDTLTASLLVILPQIIIVIVQPIVSYKSDRHRGPWGRRIPFLLLPTPFAVLSMVGLAFSPFLGNLLGGTYAGRSLGLDRSTLLFYALFWITFEVATTVADSVYRAFVNDVVPRPVIGRFYGLFRTFSLIAGMVINRWFFGKASDHYIAIFIGIGLVYGIGFTIMGLKVKEGQYPRIADPEPADLERQLVASKIAGIKTYFRDCFTHPYYFMLFAAIVLPNLAFIPINTFNLYFAQSVGLTATDFGHLKSDYFFLSLLQTIPLGWLADKFHPLRVSIIALILHGAASFWGGFFGHSPTGFAIAFIATGTLSGTWFTATASMAQVLMPRIKFAQYYSAMAAIQSLLTIVISLGIGRLLDFSGHQYRYTYLIGGIFDVLGLLATIWVFRMFLKLGGMKQYVAP